MKDTAGGTSIRRLLRQRRMRMFVRGYTVVEVAMAMTLFAIGATSIVAMERSSVQADFDAREQDIATNIASMWVERVRRDAALWTWPDQLHPPPADNRNSNTHYLVDALFDSTSAAGVCPVTGGDGGATSRVWFSPVSTATTPAINLSATNVDGESYLFDMFGHDLNTGYDGSEQFCAQISNCWQDNPADGVHKVVQTSVRVIWPRRLNSAPASTSWCTTPTAGSSAALDTTAFRFVSQVTLIQQTPH